MVLIYALGNSTDEFHTRQRAQKCQISSQEEHPQGCLICNRMLREGIYFCCLACKVAALLQGFTFTAASNVHSCRCRASKAMKRQSLTSKWCVFATYFCCLFVIRCCNNCIIDFPVQCSQYWVSCCVKHVLSMSFPSILL